jgi:hypothetical protein
MALTKPKLSTNINTDSSVFTDPILVLHQGSSVADVDVGFLMNRSNGLTANAAVIWQESSRSFVHILTDSSGAPDANLNVQSYANVSVGNVLLINNAGIYVDGTLGTAGQVLASDGSKTYWAPPGGFTGGTVSGVTIFQSNLVVSNTTVSTNTTTGALVVLGGVGIDGNVYSNALYTATGVYWSGNGQAFTSTTLANTAEITANLSSGQNVGLSLTTTGVVAGNYGSATSIPTIVVDSKGRITSVTSNAVSTTITLAGGSGSGSVAGGGTLTVNGTTNQITTAVSGSTITIALAQDVTAPGNLTVAGNLVVQGNTTTLNTETLTIEDLNITVANGAVNAAAADGAGITVGGANARLLYKSATDSWVFDRGVFASGNLVANSTTTSTSTTTGALVVTGGAGVSGNLYVSNISVGSGNIQFAQKSGMISGATAYLSLLGNPSGSAGISALELAGYTGVAGGTQSRLDFVSKVSNVFYNTSRISSTNGPSSTAAGQLVFSTTPDGGSLTERLRIKDDGPIVTAANIVAVGSATSNTTTGAIVVVGGIGLSGGIIAGGNIVAAAVTNSVSTTTGALVVRGGAGVAGNVYMDRLYTTNGLYWSGNGNVIVTGGGATLGFPNSTVAVFPTGDYGDLTATKDAFGVHIDTTYDLMEPIGSYSTTDLN